MGQITINRDELRDKVYGCWLGKSIGGTLGGPFEGRRELLEVTGYTTPAGEPMPNDDLDLQLVWLKAVQEHGPRAISNRLLGEYWLNFIPVHWNEYGIGKANMRAGLIPPLSGEYHNPWKHSNGAWIRSELWACLSPGCPDIAIRYAYEDASVDHGGGEGTYAALFTAAVQSAAFVLDDRDELIRLGLSKLPEDSRVARSIRIVLDAHAQGLDWKQAREKVLTDNQDLGWFQAPANVAFAILGWMYGEGDFGQSLCLAVNCGDDTDCTAATLGATLGILRGRKGIPAAWTEPIGDRIITAAVDRGSFFPPGTLAELTEQVMAQVPGSLAAFGAPVAVSDEPSDLSGVGELDLTDDAVAQRIWRRSPYAVVHDCVHTLAVVDYGREPDITPGEPFPMQVTLINQLPDCRHMELAWHLPEGWSITPSARNHFTLWNEEVLFGKESPDRQQVVSVEIHPGQLTGEGTYKGLLEIIAPGRPTVGAVPLVFFAAG
ncbi:MAG: ADP-ribosylglycohydrolase family protein [Phycisphaeraceae bacterium]